MCIRDSASGGPGVVSRMGNKKKKKDKPTKESGLQYYTGVKKHGKEYMKKAAKAGREGASQEELGRLKDKYSKAEKNEGKSPHKKGTKKYKAHMAAMHAG